MRFKSNFNDRTFFYGLTTQPLDCRLIGLSQENILPVPHRLFVQTLLVISPAPPSSDETGPVTTSVAGEQIESLSKTGKEVEQDLLPSSPKVFYDEDKDLFAQDTSM